MTMMAIILLFYFAWLVLALVVVGPVMMTFLPVLLLPALVVPIVVTHYVPMLMARAVEGLEYAAGIGANAPLKVGDEVKAVVRTDKRGRRELRELGPAKITRSYPGWLFRLFRGDLYDVELASSAHLTGVSVVNDLHDEKLNPYKIIQRSAAATSPAATLQLEAKEKEQIQEVTLVLKASVTQVVCIVVMALPMLQFYRDDQEWGEHALDFISATFGIEELSLQFGLSISWPSFEMPEISATYFLGIGILFLTLLRSYATQLLAWCSGQTWFAMSEASPGMWEERAMTAFSYSRYVQG